jgi:hypothetical protein
MTAGILRACSCSETRGVRWRPGKFRWPRGRGLGARYVFVAARGSGGVPAAPCTAGATRALRCEGRCTPWAARAEPRATPHPWCAATSLACERPGFDVVDCSSLSPMPTVARQRVRWEPGRRPRMRPRGPRFQLRAATRELPLCAGSKRSAAFEMSWGLSGMPGSRFRVRRARSPVLRRSRRGTGPQKARSHTPSYVNVVSRCDCQGGRAKNPTARMRPSGPASACRPQSGDRGCRPAPPH